VKTERYRYFYIQWQEIIRRTYIKALAYLRDDKMRGYRASPACKRGDCKRGALPAGLWIVRIELTDVVVPADLRDWEDKLRMDFYLYHGNRQIHNGHRSRTADRYSYFDNHFDNRFDSYYSSGRWYFA